MAAPSQQVAQQMQTNRDFMRYSYLQPILANAQNGTTYSAGQLMNFDVPIIPGGFIELVRIYTTLTFTYTPGTGGVTVNAGAHYNAYSDITVNFGNKQASLHPYLTKVLTQLFGYNRTANGVVLGAQSANVQGLLHSVPAITSGANTWQFYYDLPLNLIHPTSPYGLIPVGGSGTRMQIQLTPQSAFAGADPLNNVVNLSGNATITNVTGTTKVALFYRDFKSFATPQALRLDLTGLPTAQIIRMRDTINIAANTYNYLSFQNPYPFNKVVSIVIDGQSSSTFCAATNISGYRLDGAENTSSQLRVWDATTGGMANYFSWIRKRYGQELGDDGVLVYDANGENTADTSLQEGEMWLNLAATGYPAARAGFQVGATGAVCTPRVVTFGVLMNPMGIN